MTMTTESEKTKTRRLNPVFDVVKKCLDMLYGHEYGLSDDAFVDLDGLLSIEEELCMWYVNNVPRELTNVEEFEKYRRYADASGEPIKDDYSMSWGEYMFQIACSYAQHGDHPPAPIPVPGGSCSIHDHDDFKKRVMANPDLFKTKPAVFTPNPDGASKP